ncbi:MAG: diaminopimelate epimerase [Gammaproteobacteria bacterium]
MAANTIRFSKMHGLGNDFMVIDTKTQAFEPSPAQVRAWSNRHTGVGFDQLLLITNSDSADIDFGYRIFNADGTEVQQCGNGVRCLARYVKEHGMTNKAIIRVATKTTTMQLRYQDDKRIEVDMGCPTFEPSSLPFRYPAQQTGYELELDGEPIHFGAVSMGNPHIVIPVNDINIAPVEKVGAALTQHPAFPEGVNVGFMQIVSRDHIKLRVYERGAGETLACGSGACAAVTIGQRWELLDNRVTVDLLGGELTIAWAGINEPVYMIGSAEYVYDGEIK